MNVCNLNSDQIIAVPVAIPIKATLDCLKNITLRPQMSHTIDQMTKFLEWQTGKYLDVSIEESFFMSLKGSPLINYHLQTSRILKILLRITHIHRTIWKQNLPK